MDLQEGEDEFVLDGLEREQKYKSELIEAAKFVQKALTRRQWQSTNINVAGGNVTVYKRKVVDSGFLCHKASTTLSGTAKALARRHFSIGANHKQKTGLGLLGSGHVLEEVSQRIKIEYSVMKMPWPVWSRDFVCIRGLVDDPTTGTLYEICKSTTHPDDPAPKDKVRGKLLSALVFSNIQSPERSGDYQNLSSRPFTVVTHLVHVDPCGGVPKWLSGDQAECVAQYLRCIQQLQEKRHQKHTKHVTTSNISPAENGAAQAVTLSHDSKTITLAGNKQSQIETSFTNQVNILGVGGARDNTAGNLSFDMSPEPNTSHTSSTSRQTDNLRADEKRAHPACLCKTPSHSSHTCASNVSCVIGCRNSRSGSNSNSSGKAVQLPHDADPSFHYHGPAAADQDSSALVDDHNLEHKIITHYNNADQAIDIDEGSPELHQKHASAHCGKGLRLCGVWPG